MPSNYRNGADLERAAKHALEDNGYYVIKSGGSKGIVDLVADKRLDNLYVQCKIDGYLSPSERASKRLDNLYVQCKIDGYLSPAERVRFLNLCQRLGKTPIVARWWKPGTAARVVAFYELTSAGQVEWSPDYGIANARATESAT